MTTSEFREAYKAFGWTQAEVARRLGYTGKRASQTISDIVRGDSVPAPVSLLMRFYQITDPALWPALEDCPT